MSDKDQLVTGFGKVRSDGRSISQMFDLDDFYRKGYKGNGIKIAILDSGLGINYQNAKSQEGS